MCKKKGELECETCENSCPFVYKQNHLFVEIFSICNSARDGMSGALDYGVLIKVMDMYKLSDSIKLDIMDKVKEVESDRISSKKKRDVVKKEQTDHLNHQKKAKRR